MSEELDWQPVRIALEADIIKAHGQTRYGPFAGTIVRVKLWREKPWGPDRLCNSPNFFILRPEDALRMTGESFVVLCEHQILAD